ncbi:hypothetical protein Agub_g12101 [Astrephomene gubernaculifera]|uniref:SGNH hydrolase-type esterase domain-containing protein n=1 Tax=Astrephomene gubernaculifera TaxID=47775 RepID=A0AAD3DXV2_9CHLO|nr:hypothetical protein Agub_g12101 [Astrephomene gubernaculifera]
MAIRQWAFSFSLACLIASFAPVKAAQDPTLYPNYRPIRDNLLWSRSIHSLEPSAKDVLKPFFNYKFYLPEEQLRAAMGHVGSSIRLRKFAMDLIQGSRPLKIGAVGGSITFGTGASKIRETDWWSVFADWLASSARGNITSQNGAVCGTPSAYMAICLENSLTPDVDLVFLEYAWNDAFDDQIVNNRPVVDMERLIRRILNFPSRPAVVLMQVALVTDQLAAAGPFYRTVEDVESVLASYYDLSYLSNRNGLYQLAVHTPTAGFTFPDVFVDHHPGDTGHKIMADIGAYMIQNAILSVLLSPLSTTEWTRLGEPLIPPMYPNNEVPPGVVCTSGDPLKKLVVASDGWEWKNEGTDIKPKWGYVSYAPGSKLVLRVGTERPSVRPASRIPVLIHYLGSYEFMGTVLVTCQSGCTCNPREIDGTIARRVSQTFFAQVEASQAEVCDIVITLLDKTTSNGHHFKVSGIVVSDTDSINSVFHREKHLMNNDGHPTSFNLLRQQYG